MALVCSLGNLWEGKETIEKAVCRLRNGIHFAFKILFRVHVKSLENENRFSPAEGKDVEILKLFLPPDFFKTYFLKFAYIFLQMYLYLWLAIYKLSEGFIYII